MTTTEFYNNLNETIHKERRTLMFKFLMIFSRFEYALKASGFLPNSEGRASANWDDFIFSIKDEFDKNKNDQLSKAVDYIIENPPKVQIVNINNRQLGWENRNTDSNVPDINKLCQSIRDIRNNFFHGGKYRGNYQADVSGNCILLDHAITIMNAWLDLNDTVRHNFLEAIS